MENELDKVRIAAQVYAKKHPEFIREDADILKEDKPKRGAKPGNKNAVKKGLPTFNAQKVLDSDAKTHHIDSSKPERSARTNALIRSALKSRWLAFLNKPMNTNKTVNQVRADFVHELFTELGI